MEENEMLEQTSETENVETQTTEENVEGIELTDTAETEIEQKNNSEPAEEKEEVKKTLRDLLKENPEYQEEYNNMLKTRLDRADKKYQEELSKYRDTDNVLRSTLKLKDGDDTNAKLREYYENEGVKLPEKLQTDISDDDYEDLGIRDAEKIYSISFNYAEEEANRLAKIGYANLNTRERACFNKLAGMLTLENEKRELRSLGAKEELISNKSFNDFRKKFTSNVPIKEVYEMYMERQPKPKVDNPGSLKSDNSKANKTFISEQEYENMTREEVRKNMALIEASMPKW